MLPTIKVDADSRNIEEIEVDARSRARSAPGAPTRRSSRLAIDGIEFSDYEGMMPEMDEGTLVIDDISHHESERLIELYKPDVFCAGIKEKFAVQKMGIPCKQLHSYDYGGPYAGFRGGDQLLPRDRPDGQHADLDVHPAALGEKPHRLATPPRREDRSPRPRGIAPGALRVTRALYRPAAGGDVRRPHRSRPANRTREPRGGQNPMLLRHTHRRSRRAPGPDGQPGQDLQAHRRDVRRPGHPQLPAAQPRLAGLLLLSPQHAHPARTRSP